MSFILCGIAKFALEKDQGFSGSGSGPSLISWQNVHFRLCWVKCIKDYLSEKAAKEFTFVFLFQNLISGYGCMKKGRAHCFGCGSERESYSEPDFSPVWLFWTAHSAYLYPVHIYLLLLMPLNSGSFFSNAFGLFFIRSPHLTVSQALCPSCSPHLVPLPHCLTGGPIPHWLLSPRSNKRP